MGNNETYVLNLTTHTSLCDAAATEDLHRVLRALLCAACAVHLEECDGTRELRGLLLVRLSRQKPCQHAACEG